MQRGGSLGICNGRSCALIQEKLHHLIISHLRSIVERSIQSLFRFIVNTDYPCLEHERHGCIFLIAHSIEESSHGCIEALCLRTFRFSILKSFRSAFPLNQLAQRVLSEFICWILCTFCTSCASQWFFFLARQIIADGSRKCDESIVFPIFLPLAFAHLVACSNLVVNFFRKPYLQGIAMALFFVNHVFQKTMRAISTEAASHKGPFEEVEYNRAADVSACLFAFEQL
mmetsp:Transcript_5111/g.9312  ORF Transcript_5111/g.9312 Transcript_5111/m.9312 type:complete len:228 (-) Transcript_5111:215-898(-)